MNRTQLAQMSAADIIAFATGETVKKAPARKVAKKQETQTVAKSAPLSNIKGSRRVIDNKVEKVETDYADFYVRRIPAGVKKDRVGIAIKKALG